MKCRNKAYHRLVLPNQEIVLNPVVVFDEKGNVMSWHERCEEEPFTEWVGGEYVINEKAE